MTVFACRHAGDRIDSTYQVGSGGQDCWQVRYMVDPPFCLTVTHLRTTVFPAIGRKFGDRHCTRRQPCIVVHKKE
jgi:hypothetical protein